MKKYTIIVLSFLLVFITFNMDVVYALSKHEHQILIEPLGIAINDDSSNLYKEQEEVVQVFNSGNKKIYITNKDIFLMSQIVYAESKGEPYDGKVAVASVILNRVKHPSFPKTIEGVVKERNAFSCIKNGEINVNPDSDCQNAVLDAIKGVDPSNSAVFFYNPKTATSKWMKDVEKINITSIGNHVFFTTKK